MVARRAVRPNVLGQYDSRDSCQDGNDENNCCDGHRCPDLAKVNACVCVLNR